ncbi:glycoside hydrolase family 3 protein [Streptococcus sp. sy018]|uniref:glycoside hydrolase family 3 protein n=1 Tax=Streptococcus sp. sy018 TaxID=2600147 RepID=UPI0021BD57C3|nr:glycoside hydrolase family 3 N-terminal domain-containing protein [Streptococcus sp. sy018]
MKKIIDIRIGLALVFTFLLLVYAAVLPSASPQKAANQDVTQQSQKEKEIERLLKQMSLEEKVGQLFFARVPVYNVLEDLETYGLGGYMLFARDYEGLDLDGVKELTDRFQEASKIPLLVGSDEEGGAVTRISAILDTPFQSPMSLYQQGGLPMVLEDSQEKANLLKSVGIMTGFYPVADIAQYSDSFIYYRTLGADLSKTRTYIRQLVEQMKKDKFGSMLKHFPGYGDNGDSHTSMIWDNRSLAELKSYDLTVFAAGIKAGADSVLVTHNILTQIDEVPASISPKINQLLRKDLGFDGVVITDDFDMAGLADFISQEEAAYQAILAGNDMIMSSAYQSQIPYVLEKIEQGELTEKRIDESVKRVLAWKYDLGLLTKLSKIN